MMKKKVSMIPLLLPLLIVLLTVSCTSRKPPGADGGKGANPDRHFYQLVGVDHFGRSFGTVSSWKDDKQVGLFFWPWIGQPYASGVWDATRILALPDGVKLLTDPGSYDETISPDGQAHFWGEPLWGYYNSEDEWVIRKQMQMLTAAGIDFIYFDTTNALIYPNVIMKVMAVIDEYQKSGWDPPQVVFYTHSHSLETTRQLYREVYQPNRYPETWYRIDGKPVIIAYTDPADDLAEARSRGDSYTTGPLSAEILDFFHFFKPQWPSDPSFPEGFPWVEWIFPQPLHQDIDVMNVTVASHPSVPMTFTLTRGLENWGRGWDPDRKINVTEDAEKGTFFQRQWDRALEADPGMISIGGWNEWIAYKQLYDGEYMLCDAANLEFSRDIEPMKGGYEDAFYLQMIRNIRKYKGTDRSASRGERHTIDIYGEPAQWDEVEYSLANIGCNDTERNSYGVTTKVTYQQPLPPHLLQELKVANDRENIYFYIRSNNPFAAGEENIPVHILVGTGDPQLKEWECYDYMIGRDFTPTETNVYRIGKDFSLAAAGTASFTTDGNVLQIKIPRSSLGLEKEDRFYFKVASGVENPADLMSYYTSGSAMPMGRLSYMYPLN